MYDQENGLYYLQSRYYNPSWGRFINADGYASTGQGVVGTNGFAYCCNNPVSRIDPSGRLWQSIVNFFKNIFGVKSSTTATTDVSTPIVPSPSPITVTTGVTTVAIVDESSTASHPITFTHTHDILDVTESSVGIEFTNGINTYSWSGSLGGISSTYSYNHADYTQNFAAKYDAESYQVGIEISTTTIAWDGNMQIETTTYTNVSGNLWLIIAAYQIATTGSFQGSNAPKHPAYG